MRGFLLSNIKCKYWNKYRTSARFNYHHHTYLLVDSYQMHVPRELDAPTMTMVIEAETLRRDFSRKNIRGKSGLSKLEGGGQ